MHKSLIALLIPLAAFAADLEFTGGLERVTQESILIRLADGKRIEARLPKQGPLSAKAISAQYQLAAVVQIVCKPMSADRCSDIKSLQFVRPPTAKESILILGSQKLAADSPELAHIRRVNLDRAANMPNFVADETARRYTTRNTTPDAWKLVDTVESEITFKGSDPTRQHLRINGKPWTKPLIPGINWSPEFGTEIKPVFDPECPTEISFEGRQEANGKQLLVYRFVTPSFGCFGYFGYQGKHYVAARSGRVMMEDPGGSMLRYEEEAKEFTQGFPIASWKETTSWDYFKIGEESYLLPVGNDFYEGFANGDLWHIGVEFKNYRRFEAATNLTFHP